MNKLRRVVMLGSRARWVASLVAIAVASLCTTGSRAFAVDGPSFDCSKGVGQTLAIILCTVPEAAQADWDLNRAYWALFTDDREETNFNHAVSQRCGLPQLETQQQRSGRVFIQELGRRMGPGFPVPAIPAPQPLTEQHVRCVISAFHNQAAALRGRLRGYALAESNLSPEEHIDIQVALDRKGFMRNRDKRYGGSLDGQFGPNTRSAIKDFQRSMNAEPTGFLSNEQRQTLVECPEERDARAIREAAAEKARLDAIEQKRIAEQKEKDEADAKERKRLEDEAAKAADWRRKIEEAQRKGSEYAAKEKIIWSLQKRVNPMTDQDEYTASSIQSNDGGVAASVDGTCQKAQVTFLATLADAKDPNTPLGIPGFKGDGTVGNKRINDDSVFPIMFPNETFRNRIVISRLSFGEYVAEAADTTWRILGEIETGKGAIVIKIPMFDQNIQKLIASCKQQYELEKIRKGRRDAPG